MIQGQIADAQVSSACAIDLVQPPSRPLPSPAWTGRWNARWMLLRGTSEPGERGEGCVRACVHVCKSRADGQAASGKWQAAAEAVRILLHASVREHRCVSVRAPFSRRDRRSFSCHLSPVAARQSRAVATPHLRGPDRSVIAAIAGENVMVKAERLLRYAAKPDADSCSRC